VLPNRCAQDDVSQEEARRRLIECIHSLKKQAAKLDLSLARLETLESDCFSKAVWRLKSGDRVSASIYASEVAYLRRLSRTVKGIRHHLTQLTVRLETLLESKQLTTSLSNLLETLRQIPAGVDADALGELTEILCDVATSQKRAEKGSISNKLVEEVLKEVEHKASEEYQEPLAA
jgi:division protein CdvB (Snf7/Vps24/ESCRT-III family)